MVIQPDGKIVVVGYANNGTDLDFALARYNVAGCAPHKLWWGQYVASHIFVHPQDPPIGPSAPIPQLQIGRHEQFAIPASDGGAFAGPTRPGYQAFRLTNARGEDRQRGSMVAATNALGNSILEMLEAHRLLLPTDIAAERAGGAMGLGSRWAPLLKCYRVKMQSAGDTHRERKTFTLTDALGRTQNLELGEPESLCKPVDRRGRELIGPRTVSLVSYRVKDVRASGRASGGYARSVRLRATSEFVPPRVLQVEQPALLYLPSLAE